MRNIRIVEEIYELVFIQIWNVVMDVYAYFLGLNNCHFKILIKKKNSEFTT